MKFHEHASEEDICRLASRWFVQALPKLLNEASNQLVMAVRPSQPTEPRGFVVEIMNSNGFAVTFGTGEYLLTRAIYDGIREYLMDSREAIVIDLPKDGDHAALN